MVTLAVWKATTGFPIEESIISHPAWYDDITGLESEALLKGKKPYFYLLRRGEQPSHYYISFVDRDHSIRHQPFAIIYTQKDWYCVQGSGYGPYTSKTIYDLIHLIMHCTPEKCKPVVQMKACPQC